MRKLGILPLFAVGVLITIVEGCGDNLETIEVDASTVIPPDASNIPDGQSYDGFVNEPDPYVERVRTCQQVRGLNQNWANYMLAHEEKFQPGFARSLDSHPLVRVRVECWQGQCVPYLPGSECADENSHMALLKALSEAVFPRWTFEFSTQTAPEDADIVLHLKFIGYSSTLENDIYVVYESIFIHEFLHWVGKFDHHYCGDNPFDTTSCGEILPEGEGECIMSRNSVVAGTSEACVMNIAYGDLEAAKAQINDLILRLNSCYPPIFRLASGLRLLEPVPFEGMR
jgi:hypothetical protein